jgi:hypothetical protein
VKADDCFIAFACDHCHRELDQGKNHSRTKKAFVWERGHIETLPILFRLVMGQEIVNRPRPRERTGSNLSSSKILPRAA